MKMDNPTTINVIGGIIAAIVIAVFANWAGATQKRQSDKDKSDLMDANKSLDSTIKEQNKELAQKSDELTRKSDELTKKSDELTRKSDAHAEKLTVYADRIDGYSKKQEADAEKIQTLQQAQSDKSDEIAKLSIQLSDRTTELLNIITSKGSFCYIVIDIDTTNYSVGKPSVAKVSIYHSGKYTLKNVQVSLVNSDEEAYDEPGTKPLFNEDPDRFHKPSNPYIATIAVLAPNQHIALKNLDIISRPQKSFNIYFVSENNFWFQRILLRDASVFSTVNRGQTGNRFYYLTQVYSQDLNPALNQVHRFEDIIKENSNYTNKTGFDINKKLFGYRKWDDFLFTPDEKIGKYVNWFSLHWNGNSLETGRYNLPSYKTE